MTTKDHYLPFVGLDPRLKLQRVEMERMAIQSDARMRSQPMWQDFLESLRAIRLAHLEAIARADCNTDFERGVIATLDIMLNHRQPNERRLEELSKAAEGLREQIESLHDAGLLPPLEAQTP